ncbi:MAG: cytochrome P450 [Porticoccaceae bacterium]
MTTHDPSASGADGEPAFTAVSAIYDGAGLDDPHSLYARLRATSPVMEGDILARYGVPSQADYANRGRKVFTLFRNADITEVLRNDRLWTTELLTDGLGSFFGDMFLSGRSGAAHRSLRNLLQPCFAPAVLKRWQDTLITPLTENVFGSALRQKRHAELVSELFLPFPIRTIYAILGFADDPESVEYFADLALRVLAGPQVDPAKAELTMARAFEASHKLHDFIVAVVADRRAAGADGEDMISRLIRAEFEGRALSDDEIGDIVRMLLPAAAESTTRTMSNLLVHLFANPDVLARLRADRSLLPKVLKESMRLEPVAAFLARQAAEDTDIGGVAIPAGAAVSIVIASALRDETLFEHPNDFDIDRPSIPTLGFGYGAHMCLGMPVAKLEIDAAMNLLLDLPNLRLDPVHSAPVVRGMQFRGPEVVHVVWDEP